MASKHSAEEEQEKYVHFHLPSVVPIFESPYTRAGNHWGTWQRTPCADYEFYWSQCAARIGAKQAAKDCKELQEDFFECILRSKSYKRYKAMQMEREKQGRPFMEAPPLDSRRVWKKKDN